MHDIVDFLQRHPPFDSLDQEELERVAAAVEIEFHATRTPILESAAAKSEFAYVVRRGSVELLIDGRLLDLLGEERCSASPRCSRRGRWASSRARPRTRSSTGFRST